MCERYRRGWGRGGGPTHCVHIVPSSFGYISPFFSVFPSHVLVSLSLYLPVSAYTKLSFPSTYVDNSPSNDYTVTLPPLKNSLSLSVFPSPRVSMWFSLLLCVSPIISHFNFLSSGISSTAWSIRKGGGEKTSYFRHQTKSTAIQGRQRIRRIPVASNQTYTPRGNLSCPPHTNTCVKIIQCGEPAVSLHSHHVSLIQWSTRLLPVMRDLGSNPQGGTYVKPGFSC